jgi:hypothetical protein
MSAEEQKIMFEASDKILEIVDNELAGQQNGFSMPRGDLQGVIEAIILSVIYKIKKL